MRQPQTYLLINDAGERTVTIRRRANDCTVKGVDRPNLYLRIIEFGENPTYSRQLLICVAGF
jgi:hypothetical protein